MSRQAFLVPQALLDTFIAGFSLLLVTFVALRQLLALSGDNVSNLLLSVAAEDVPSESDHVLFNIHVAGFASSSSIDAAYDHFVATSVSHAALNSFSTGLIF